MSLVLVQPPDPPGMKISREWMGKFGMSKPEEFAHRDLLPPLDLASAAGLALQQGISTQIIDGPAMEIDANRTIAMIQDAHPALVVVNVSMPSMGHDLKLARVIGETGGVNVAVTGSILSVMPEVALKYPGIRFVILEPDIEFPITELAEGLRRKSSVSEIDGIARLVNGQVVSRPSLAIGNLDEIPYSAYQLLHVSKYHYSLLPKTPFVTMITGRGCPYGCIYCAYPIGYGETWRKRSPTNVVGELEQLSETYGIKSVLFRDQVFTIDMNHAAEISDLMVNKGLGIEWRCETRVDRVNRPLLEKMKRAGCIGIHMGVESGDPKLLSRMGKDVIKGVSVKHVKEAFKNAKAVGLETVANFIIGLPGETKESTLMTFELAQELDATLTNFSAATPYPGTTMYDMAKENGWIITEDWDKYTGVTAVMKTDTLSADDINRAMELNWSVLHPPTRSGLVKAALSRDGISSLRNSPKEALTHSIEILLGQRKERILQEYLES